VNVLRPNLLFGPMAAIRGVQWLVVHTQAGNPNSTAADVHAFHRHLGWSGIGYHYFIRTDGTIEIGRPEEAQGAHARGLNAHSLGICCAGHGDRSDFTSEQKAALGWLLRELRDRHGLERGRVIGHREIATLAGAPNPGKSCPGDRVNMQEIRELSDHPEPPEPEDPPARVWSRTVVPGGAWIYPTEVRGDREWYYLTERQMRRGIVGQAQATTPLSQMPRGPDA
jgi:N-acetylmuramoyl-L-alanine amidase